MAKQPATKAKPAEHRFDFDIADIAEVWRRGSVIPSWLLDLTASALVQDPALDSFSGAVADSGEGRWTVQAAIEEDQVAPFLEAHLVGERRRQRVEVAAAACEPEQSGVPVIHSSSYVRWAGGSYAQRSRPQKPVKPRSRATGRRPTRHGERPRVAPRPAPPVAQARP